MALTACLSLILLPAPAQIRMPWTFPGDFRDRLRISDLVVSGTIEHTSTTGVQTVDHVELIGNLARVRVDRVFQGSASGEVSFVWYGLYLPPTGGGVVGSLPPTANFRPHERYLLFLKQRTPGWVVAMPLYAIEVKLAPTPPSRAVGDLSQVPTDNRYEALAQELDTAALLVPTPEPDLTGEAATYFPAIFDLLGGCAQPFYRRFSSSPSPELRRAALKWLQLIQSRHMMCQSTGMPEKQGITRELPVSWGGPEASDILSGALLKRLIPKTQFDLLQGNCKRTPPCRGCRKLQRRPAKLLSGHLWTTGVNPDGSERAVMVPQAHNRMSISPRCVRPPVFLVGRSLPLSYLIGFHPVTPLQHHNLVELQLLPFVQL